MQISFVVLAEVPDGVSVQEFADHLADAHRMTVESYHPDDPLARASTVVEVSVAQPAALAA